MTNKQIKLDGSWIPMEEAIKAGLISEKDIDVISNRPDWRITLQADHIKRLEEELQAKEQECEELKEVNEEKNELLAKLGCPTIATARMKAFTLEEQLDQLKAENEELKNNITSFDYLDSLTNEQVAVLYTASIDELAIRGYKAKYNTEVSLLTRYKQALTEIKKIAEDESYVGFWDEQISQILQKCEVLDE